MPAVLTLVTVGIDGATLVVARGGGAGGGGGGGADFLSVFDKPQRDALVLLFLRFNHYQIVAAEILWGFWLFPMGALVYKSGFLPRFIGGWLIMRSHRWWCCRGRLLSSWRCGLVNRSVRRWSRS